MAQTIQPDRIVLWLSAEDRVRLPARAARLKRGRVEIRTTDDIGSFKKLVPALEAFPEAFVVTADDDVFYEPRWLERLVAQYDAEHPFVWCHRAQRPALSPDGTIAPFARWQSDVQDDDAKRGCADIIPTGVGGTLYPPHSLDPLATDVSLIRSLQLTADDFWFFWMARRAGSAFRKTATRYRFSAWPGSQEHTLHVPHAAGGYDRQIEVLSRNFGVPDGLVRS
jgi:hypothetical protein